MPGDGVLIAGADDLALSLSTLIVAGVVAVALWIAMERTTTDQARPARELYLAVVNAVSMTVLAIGAVRVLLWAVGVGDFEPSALADIAAFGAAWFIHERLRRPPEELDELRQMAGALLGLTLSSGGAFGILFASFDAIIDSGQVIVGDDGFCRSSFDLGLSCWWSESRSSGGSGSGAWPVVPAAGATDMPSSFRLRAWLTAFTAAAVIVNRLAQWIVGLESQADYVNVGQRRDRHRGERRLLAPPTGAGPGAKPADPDRRVCLVRRRAHRRGRGGRDAGGDPR